MRKETCAERIAKGLSIRAMKQIDLCEITGIPKSAMSQYVSGKFEPKQDRIYLISKALNVSEAWLMGYDVPMECASSPSLSLKDERDIARDIEGIWHTLESQEALMFDGDPMTPEAKQSIIDAMKLGMAAAKLRNKEKYNPNKNKKG